MSTLARPPSAGQGLPRPGRRGSARRMRRGIVYVLAKPPCPGQVKTRLCPPLTALQACLVAEAFATDTMTMLAAQDALEVRLALSEPGEVNQMPRLGEPGEMPGPGEPGGAPGAGEPLPPAHPGEPDRTAESAGGGALRLRELAQRLGVVVEAQGGGDLGARMARLLERGLATGLPTILVGTDSPDLPPATVECAFAALGRVDAVLVPARDGGYVLIGASRPLAGLFEIDAPWSSARVFAATCEALRREGCAFETLRTWEDVDDAAALGRLAARLDDDSAAAPATARLLEAWRRQGVRF